MDSKTVLYAVTHKEAEGVPSDRTLVGVGGREISGVSVYDSTGDNISDKNSSFCELTALYWIWKNSAAEYVGLEHYRRFFCKERLVSNRRLTKEELIEKLGRADAVLPKKCGSKSSVYGYYANAHFGSDLDVCRNIIVETCPEYTDDFDAVMKSHAAFMANMFVMKKHDVDEYCSWLFGILFEAEKRIDCSKRDEYQRRAFGFLSERLFNVWIRHKKFKVEYVPVLMTGAEPYLKRKFKGALGRVKRFFKKKENREQWKRV